MSRENTDKKKSLLKCITLNILFLVLYVFLFHFQYETNDDMAMAIISYSGDEHLVFINVLIGRFLIFLNRISSQVTWYPLLMVICLFISFCMIIYCLFDRLRDELAMFFSCLILIFFGYHTYCSLQFTEVAGVLCMAGTFMVINNTMNGKKWYASIGPLFLITLGSCYRKDMFFLMLASSSVYLLSCALRNIKDKFFFIRGMSMLTVLFMLVIGCDYVNNNAYSDEEWRYYVEFNKYRSILLDNGIPEYIDNKRTYDELGIDEEDLLYYAGWDFADPELFNLESAKKIVSLKGKLEKSIDAHNIICFFREICKGFLDYEWITLYLFSLILCYITTRKNRYLLLLQIIIFLCINAYFYFGINRYLMSRVDICIILCLTITNFLLLEEENDMVEAINMKCHIPLVAIILTIMFLMKISTQQPIILQPEKMVYEQIASDKKHLYLRTTLGSVCYDKNSIWVRPKTESDNVYLLGGWRTYTPTTLEVLKKYHVENPFRELVDESYIYIEGENRIHDTLSYIKRHYNKDAYCVLVKDVGGIKIYRVLSREIALTNAEEPPETLNSEIIVEKLNDVIVVESESYIDETNSYLGEMYAKVQIGNEEIIQCMVQKENFEYPEDDSRRYDMYSLEIKENVDLVDGIVLFYKYDDRCYKVYEYKQ